MKKMKIFLTLLFGIFLTGCNNVNLDLNRISEKLDSLTTSEFDLLTAVENIEMSPDYFDELVHVYDFDLEEMGINKDIVEDMAFKLDSDKKPAYIIMKPIYDKKEELKAQIDKYLDTFKSLSKFETEYEGYLIYLFSDKNEEMLQTIKNSKKKVFGMLMNVESSDLEALTGVNPADLDEFLVKNSVMTQASSYYILKPKAGKEEKVEDAMDNYMDKLEDQWETYLPGQYELVEEHLEEEYGSYLIYVISNNNELVFKTIKESKK